MRLLLLGQRFLYRECFYPTPRLKAPVIHPWLGMKGAFLLEVRAREPSPYCQAMPLSVRVYECPQGGLLIHRDHNASHNILAEGLQACGRAGRVVPEAPGS